MPRPFVSLASVALLSAVLGGSTLAACSKPDVHDTLGIRTHACIDCHASAYNAASAPPHVDVLAQTCGDCHNTSGWVPATVTTHPWFELTGAHLQAACTSCHAGSPAVFVGVPTACVGCHLAQYEASPYPSHGTFPKTCASCHITSNWTTVSAGIHPEAKFAITKGPHSIGVGCADCHIAEAGSPVLGANCDCIHCHLGAHNAPAIDSAHTGLGAAYTPSASAPPSSCRNCHPSG